MTKEALTLALEALERCGSENYPLERKAIKALKEALAKQEQGEPVAWVNPDDLYDLEAGEDGDVPYVVRGNEQPKNMPKSIPLYTTPQPAQKPLMLEKFSEMKALLDDSNAPQHKTITDDELKIIMETTMPVIDWKARHGVELNNGERNKWMLEWFIAFARAIEAAHGIKGDA